MCTESENSRHFREKKDPPVQEGREEDIRISLIRHAIRAPSHRNSQPWKIALRGTRRIVLSIDHSRVAGALDPSGRQAFLSCGTFLENLDIAARAFGYRADLDLFPAGWPDPVKPLHDPVANIDLERDERVEPDPLFHAIPIRQTNRRPYSDTSVPLSVAGELAAAGDSELVPFGFTNDRNLIREIRDLATEALARELSDRERFREYCEYFRFTDTEAARHRDGYGLAQSGHGKITRFFTGAFLFSRKSVLRNPEAFQRRTLSDLAKIMEKCGGIGWLSTKGDFRIDQVRAGMVFERIHLKASSLSLALQPVASVVSGYGEMEEVRARFLELLAIPGTHTIQVLFRTGYVKRVPQTPRRDIFDFIVS